MERQIIYFAISLIVVNYKVQTPNLVTDEKRAELVTSIDNICWSKDLMFDSSHFKSIPNDSILTYYNTQPDAVASIYINIVKIDEVGTNYHITACFDPNSSWIRKYSEMLFDHEMYHFDIAELYARKIRKSVDSLRKLDILDSKVFDQIISKKNLEYEKFNMFFDKRTMHGSAIIPQDNIMKGVYRSLNELHMYELDYTQCNCEE